MAASVGEVQEFNPANECETRSVERELSVLWGRSRALSVDLAPHVHPEVDAASYVMLLQLRQWGSVRAADAAERTGFDKSTVSRQLGKLESLGLIERVDDPADRRSRLVQLTAEGRSRLDAVSAQRQRLLRQRLQDWSPRELSYFAALLNRFNNACEHQHSDCG